MTSARGNQRSVGGEILGFAKGSADDIRAPRPRNRPSAAYTLWACCCCPCPARPPGAQRDAGHRLTCHTLKVRGASSTLGACCHFAAERICRASNWRTSRRRSVSASLKIFGIVLAHRPPKSPPLIGTVMNWMTLSSPHAPPRGHPAPRERSSMRIRGTRASALGWPPGSKMNCCDACWSCSPPHMGPVAHRHLRRVLTRRFSYAIYYRLTAGHIEVRACPD